MTGYQGMAGTAIVTHHEHLKTAYNVEPGARRG